MYSMSDFFSSIAHFYIFNFKIVKAISPQQFPILMTATNLWIVAKSQQNLVCKRQRLNKRLPHINKLLLL